jgi:WD40 repeat protein
MGTEERTLSENAAWEFVMTVMPDGRHMVTASYGGEITIWDLVTGAADHSLSMYGLGTRLLSVAVLPDGQRVISASSDETLKVWDLATGTEERTLTGHRSDVFTVMVMPDGGQVISASADGTLKVWDLVTGDEGRTLTGHRSGVLAVAATPDGRRVISASHDCTLKVWDLATGQLLSSIAPDAPVECVAVAPDGATFFAGDRMGDVYCLCYVETATDSGKERI